MRNNFGWFPAGRDRCGRRAASVGLVVLSLAWVGESRATDLAGMISGVFTSAGNPYRITALSEVAAGDTARFEAGCEIRFVAGTELQVFGRLEIAGSAGAPVELVADAALPVPGSWLGVTSFGAGSLHFRHFAVENAETAIHVLGGSGDLRFGSVDLSSKYGVRLDVTDALARDLVITRAGQGNPGFTGLFVGGGAPLIEDCVVSDCAGSAVGVFSPGAPTLRRCDILTSRSGVTCVGANARFEDCVIRDHGFDGDFNTGAGLFIGFASGTPTVTGCVIEDNFFGVSVINDGRINLGNLGNADPLDDGGNTFRSNDDFDGTTRHVWNDTPTVVKGEGNVWTDGSGVANADSATIDAWVFDNEERAMAEVDFLPLANVTDAPVVGGGQQVASSSWALWPNPARDRVVLSPRALASSAGSLGDPESSWTADLVDVSGRRLERFLRPLGGSAWEMRVPETLPAGNYFLVVRRDGRSQDVLRFVRLR